MHTDPLDAVRLSELLVALSVATDLGMGQPPGHAVRTCLIAAEIGRGMGLAEREVREVHQVALLRFVGCTADAHEIARFAGDEIALAVAVAPWVMAEAAEHDRALGLSGVEEARTAAAVAHCEAAVMLAQRLGLSPGVVSGLRHGFERWDGRGYPAQVPGEQVPLSARIAVLARDVELFHRVGGVERAIEVVRSRRGRAYDPTVVDVFLAEAGRILDRPEESPAAAVVEGDTDPPVDPAELDELFSVFADFADVKLPQALGHSRTVADLARGAALELGLPESDAARVHRAGLLHDLGSVGISSAVWGKADRLNADEWERIRLHPYLTERVLNRSPALRPLAELAGGHHERLDGAGYHRGTPTPSLLMQILAAADSLQAMTQDRPHRAALSPPQAADALAKEANEGRLDRRAVAAVIGAAGQVPRRLPARWPDGLTDREVDVLRLACRGSSRQEVATSLRISAKTVSRHLENAYAKIGVRTRAGAALYAVAHGLLAAE